MGSARRVFLRRVSRRLGSARFSFATKWIGLSALIGVVGGLMAAIFDWMVKFVAKWSLEYTIGLTGESAFGLGPERWWLLVIPAAGGVAVGLIVQRFAPETRGHGTEQLIQAFHRFSGRVRRRVIALKALCSALTVGTGGSGGLEGPVGQIGSGVGSALADGFGLGARDRRVFLLAGASAGIGALFTAPLGGALFAPEVLYRKPELEGEAIIPCIVSSIVAYTTFVAVTGKTRAIDLPGEVLQGLVVESPTHLLFYTVLALVCVLVGWLWVRGLERTTARFASLERVPLALRAGLGGMLVGALALALVPLTGEHGILFSGYGLIRSSIIGEIALGATALLVLAKILATSLTIGSGGSGGVFLPSLVIGALTGAGVGAFAAQLFPGFGLNPSAFALVGMGGFLAGVAKTPIAAVLMVCEMTGSYTLLAPLLLVSVVHLVFSRGWSLYSTQVGGVFESPAHAEEVIVDVLAALKVEDVIDRAAAPQSVSQNATLRKALDIVSKAHGSYFPVVDGEGELVGIFSLSDVRRIFLETDVHDLVIVKDFMVDRVRLVHTGESLDTALSLLNELAVHEVPVVERDAPGRVIAMLTRNQIGAAYHQRLRELRRLQEG